MTTGMGMGGGLFGGGSNGMMDKLMEQKMLSAMFGIQAHVEPVEVDGTITGLDAEGEPGFVSVRLMPPQLTSPYPQILLGATPRCTLTPDKFLELSKFFQQNAKKYEESFAAQVEVAKSMEGYEFFAAALGQ